MIYLFCNENYGQPFLAAAKQYIAYHPNTIRIVLSGKRHYPKNRLKKLIAKLKFLIRKKQREVFLSYQHQIPVLVIENVNLPNFQKKIRSEDSGIVAGFNQIFSPTTITRFNSLVNFHPSLLPFYRGPIPSYWCLKNNEKKTGYTLHRITPEIDAGEILFQAAMEIGEIQNPDELDRAIAQTAVPTFLNYLDHLRTGKPWSIQKLDATTFYSVLIDYASFPK